MGIYGILIDGTHDTENPRSYRTSISRALTLALSRSSHSIGRAILTTLAYASSAATLRA